LFAKDAKQGCGRGIDAHDLDPLLPQRRRNLAADEAHADDGSFAARDDLTAKRVRVAHGTEIEHIPQLQTRNRRPPVPHASGNQQLVEAHRSASAQLDLPLRNVDARCGGAKARLDSIRVVKPGRTDERFFERRLPA
jgi:hypothetical protein